MATPCCNFGLDTFTLGTNLLEFCAV